MNSTVYKTSEGREIVESMYRDLLAGHKSPEFSQIYVPTEVGRTHVLRFGDTSNRPLMMIHGSVSNSATWLGNVSDFIDSFCVYCVDIPGEPGLSEPVRQPLASEAPLTWLNSLLDYLGIETPSFVTMSLGSWYGLNFAIHNAGRIRALSMITTGGIVPAKAGFFFKAVLFGLLGKTGRKMITKAVCYKTELPPEALEFQSVTAKHFNPVLEAIPVFTDTQLKKITAPVQFFGGDHDALIDSVKTAERLKKLLPHSEIRILKDTGHVIIDQFAAIRSFLDSN